MQVGPKPFNLQVVIHQSTNVIGKTVDKVSEPFEAHEAQQAGLVPVTHYFIDFLPGTNRQTTVWMDPTVKTAFDAACAAAFYQERGVQLHHNCSVRRLH